MSKIAHRIYIFTLVSITLVLFVLIGIYGAKYYLTDIDQRFFHEQNELLKPSGFIGHGAGIVGSLMMIIGVFGYMARNKVPQFNPFGHIKTLARVSYFSLYTWSRFSALPHSF